jgi:hypothetical protein
MDSSVSLELLATMPMRFAGLVLENTNQCNSKCGMCYQSSGPKGSDVLGKAHLKFEVMAQLIREARAIPTLSPRFHLAGGEAFMHMDECLALYRVARDAGYIDLTGTTNGTWAHSDKVASTCANRLRDAGVTSLEISWDYWHQAFIPAESVGRAITACFEAGIETNIRVLTTRSHNLEEALRPIPQDDLARATRITSGPVFATGRASLTIPSDEFHDTGAGLNSACHPTLNLTVNSFGNVFPCCAGFDQTEHYLFGNVHDESIAVIAERINADPIARTVVFRGVRHLVPVLEAAGIDLQENFRGICQLCWTIFSSPACVKALREHTLKSQQRALERLSADIL